MLALPWTVTLAGRMEAGGPTPSGDHREPARCSMLPLHLHSCQAPYAQAMMTSTIKHLLSAGQVPTARPQGSLIALFAVAALK